MDAIDSRSPRHLTTRHAERPRDGHPTERRTDARAPVDVLLNRFLNGYPYLCRATDISRHGMRLQTFREPAGAPRYMGLQFQLPGSEDVITASGEAVFEDDSARAVGVRFTALPEPAAAAIDRFLAEQARLD
jgi:hypothetical protein